MTFDQHAKNALIRFLEHSIKELQAALEHAQYLPIKKSCRDCLNFDAGSGLKGQGKCLLVHSEPPPEVLENGCESHVFNQKDVPFPC